MSGKTPDPPLLSDEAMDVVLGPHDSDGLHWRIAQAQLDADKKYYEALSAKTEYNLRVELGAELVEKDAVIVRANTLMEQGSVRIEELRRERSQQEAKYAALVAAVWAAFDGMQGACHCGQEHGKLIDGKCDYYEIRTQMWVALAPLEDGE